MIDAQSPEGRDRLSAALGVRRWVDEVAAGGPYESVDALVAAGELAAADLSDTELDEAIAPAVLPSGKQAGLGAAEEGDDAALARGEEVYEQRFGRTFVIRASGRSRQEVLDELQRRLRNDEADEAAEAKEQLRQIVGLRLAALFTEGA